MLTIREAQMAAFREAKRADFERRLSAHVRQFWPDRCQSYTESETLDRVRSGVERAERYGISTEYDVARFVVLVFALGSEFDALPEAAAILTSENISATAKIDELCRCAAYDLDQTALAMATHS